MSRSEVRNATRPYGGYEAARSRRVDEELADTDKGKPCGEYLRRFWHPVCKVSEVGGHPVALDILGEELVVFRDLSGRLGLLHRRCAHRGASLEFGLVTTEGIRCAYHGWHYAPDGLILQAPAEPVPGAMARRLCQGAYPVRQHGGLVFAYMGPPDAVPEFPVYDFMDAPGERLVPYRFTLPTNWLHVRENAQDPIHLSFLHSMFDVKQFGDFALDLPAIRSHRTPLGIITSSVRRIDQRFYFRVNEMIMPNVARLPDAPAWGEAVPANLCDFTAPGKQKALKYCAQVPASHGLGLTIYVVPHDNRSCQMIGWIHAARDEDPEVTDHGMRAFLHGQVQDRSYAERQANPGDGDVLTSQGPEYALENDNLTGADAGIALYRRLLRAEIRSLATGNAPTTAAGARLPTYGYSVFRPAPPRGTDEQEREQRKGLATELVEKVLAGTLERTPRVLVPVPASEKETA